MCGLVNFAYVNRIFILINFQNHLQSSVTDVTAGYEKL